ncbi:alpha/beta fold hydrolase [Shimia abyssi]|uniref:Pimeloyl-ACP methyl ester carboxylesterase n=1 Tax=Shimia abyssi TaxID=1662395 RepID=A0A2P8FGS3_9RHOB|nr:alpha/beta hydrolase [Shimia abyssi]PSL20898.1 pimeloyl-ACP methyl ester carboxylesterase [Shimia abyssi]
MATILAILAVMLIALVVRTQMLARKAEAALPAPGAFQQVDGAMLHFVEQGPKDAQTLVLIHGLAGNLHHFTYGMSDLLAQDFHVIAVDRPGCGYSTRDNDGLAHLGEQAEMLWAFLDARGVKNPVLVGHSLGGSVALAMALLRPDRPSALALLCPATHPMPKAPAVFRPLQLRSTLSRRLFAYTIVSPMTRLIQPKVLRSVFAPEPVVPNFQTRGGGWLALRPETFISASADLMGTSGDVASLIDRYKTDLKTPGAILFSENDTVLSASHHGTPMAQYGLPMKTLPGRGHMIPMTAPKECADFVREIARAT